MANFEGDIRIVLFVKVDRIIHTEARPLCSDPTCPCHGEAKEETTIEVPRRIEMPEVLICQ